MVSFQFKPLILALVATTALVGCQNGANPFAAQAGASNGAKQGAQGNTSVAAASSTSIKLVDRDVEAPEIFQTTDDALWDGRPSLGGVWVASPDAKDPERVILRNSANGKFVIGALFRRERDNPGPKLQISSDAAAALGLLAGQPGKVSVTALRREEAKTAAPDATKPLLDAAETVASEGADVGSAAVAALGKGSQKPIKGGAITTGAIATAPLDDGQTLGKPPAKTPAPKNPTAVAPAAAAPAAPKPAAASGTGGLIQIGIFSVEANAKRAQDTLTKAGIPASMRKEESQGKPFWSVTTRGDAGMLKAVKGAGFKDAYFLKG